MASIVFGPIRWCVWSFRPSSPLRLPHLKFLFVCLFECLLLYVMGIGSNRCTVSEGVGRLVAVGSLAKGGERVLGYFPHAYSVSWGCIY